MVKFFRYSSNHRPHCPTITAKFLILILRNMPTALLPPHQAAALTGSSATHTHIDTSPHRVTTEGGHWHRRAICLQGVEALEPPRHHHRAIRMQHHTPMSDHHTKQPPSLWYQSHTYRPRHTTPPSYRPARE